MNDDRTDGRDDELGETEPGSTTTPLTNPGPPETDLHNEKVDEPVDEDERFDAG